MTDIIPTPGRIVLYRVNGQQALEINRRRKDAFDRIDWHRAIKSGAQVHIGNEVNEGDIFPMIIVRVWGETPTCAVNGQVLLDGADTLWATSVSVGDRPGSFHWMAYQKAVAAGEVEPTKHA